MWGRSARSRRGGDTLPYLRDSTRCLYYEVYGAGRPLVLLHGRGGNTLIWWQQADFLAARYRVVIVDQRGWGRSSGPLPDPWADAFVPDLAAVLDQLGIDACALVAQSMGGWTASGFCRGHPGRVRAAVMSGTTGGYAPAAMEPVYLEAGRRSEAMRVAWQAGEGPHPAIGARMYREQPALARLYEMINALNPPAGARTGLPRGAAQRLAVPEATLFITGEEDPLCPTPMVEAVAAECAGAEVRRFPDAGHSVYFERASAFNEAVATFLARHYPA